MNTLEISTITILHTMSKLNAQELSMLLLIANSKPMEDIAQIRGCSLHDIESQVHTLLEKFEVSTLSDMASMLNEMNIGNFLKQK